MTEHIDNKVVLQDKVSGVHSMGKLVCSAVQKVR